MKKNLTMIVLFALMLSCAHAETQKSLETIEGLTIDISKIENNLSGLKSRLNTMLLDIEKQKRAQEANYSIFREMKIENLLKKAKSLTDEISSLDSRKGFLEKRMVSKKIDRVTSLNEEINDLLIRTRKDPSKPTLLRLKDLIMERASITQELTSRYNEGKDTLDAYPGDSPEDLAKKVNILEDYKKRLMGDLDAIVGRLLSARKQKSALNEIIHLLEEEDFFTETAFFKSVKRSDISTDVASKTEPLPTDDGLSPDVPEEPSVTEPASPEIGSAETDSGTVDKNANNSANTGSVDLNAGLEPPSDKDADAPQKVLRSGMDSKIAVLERERIKLSRLIQDIEDNITELKAESKRIKNPRANPSN